MKTQLFALVICALLFGGCTPSLAKVASEPPRPEFAAGATPDLSRCEKLSKAEAILRYVAIGNASLAGASGLSQIPIGDDPTARAAMAGVTGAFAAAAALVEAERAQVGADFERECNP